MLLRTLFCIVITSEARDLLFPHLGAMPGNSRSLASLVMTIPKKRDDNFQNAKFLNLMPIS